MEKTEHDCIIIGGGINGAGIARDCSLRGMKPLLIEKHDFARGASGNNTGMIHGGIRYMRYDVNTTKKSCIDAGYIHKIAPHLMFRIPFLFPVLKGDQMGALLLEGAEIFFEAYDNFQPYKGGKPHTRLTKQETLDLEPGLTPNIIGSVSMDEWWVNAFRLTLENALDAQQQGAIVRNYCMFTSFILAPDNRVVGVRFYDRVKHKTEEHHAPIVINAAGGFGPRVTAGLGIPYKLRHGKGVHIVYTHRISNYGFVMHAIDGRQMFFLPHSNGSVIGTTDDDFYDDLDQPPVIEDEVKYIIQSARRIFPTIDRYQPARTYVGVRPTIYEWGKNEDVLSREHAILDHALDGFPGLWSVMGGKLAAYRILAEEVSDVVAQALGNKNPCLTHEALLPGAQLSRACNKVVRGNDKAKVDVTTASVEICFCLAVDKAAISESVENELIQKTSDLSGRTGIFRGLCGGTHCIAKTNQIVAKKLQLDIDSQLLDLKEALNTSFYERKMVMEGANLAKEELNQAAYFLSGNLLPYFAAAEAVKDSRVAEVPQSPADSRETRQVDVDQLIAEKAIGSIT